MSLKITLYPRLQPETLAVVKNGDVLTINGAGYDFSSIEDGDILSAGATGCDWIAGRVERKSGVLHVPLYLPHGPNPSSFVAFPQPIIDPADGPIALPFDPPPPVDIETVEDPEAGNVDA